MENYNPGEFGSHYIDAFITNFLYLREEEDQFKERYSYADEGKWSV